MEADHPRSGIFLKWGGKSLPGFISSAVRIREFHLSPSGAELLYSSQAQGQDVSFSLEHDVAEIASPRIASKRELDASVRYMSSGHVRISAPWCFDMYVHVHSTPAARTRKLTIFSLLNEGGEDAESSIQRLHALITAYHIQGVLPGADLESDNQDKEVARMADHEPLLREHGAAPMTPKTPSSGTAVGYVSDWTTDEEGRTLDTPEKSTSPQTPAPRGKEPILTRSLQSFLLQQCENDHVEELLHSAANQKQVEWRHVEVKVASAKDLQIDDAQNDGRQGNHGPYCKVHVRWGEKPYMVTTIETSSEDVLTQEHTLSPEFHDPPVELVVQHIPNKRYHSDAEPFLKVEVWDRDPHEKGIGGSGDHCLGEALLELPPWSTGVKQDDLHECHLPLCSHVGSEATSKKRRIFKTDGRKTSKDNSNSKGEVLLQVKWNLHTHSSRRPPVLDLVQDEHPVTSGQPSMQDMQVTGTEPEETEAVDEVPGDMALADGIYWKTPRTNHGKPVYYHPNGYLLMFWDARRVDGSATQGHSGWWISPEPQPTASEAQRQTSPTSEDAQQEAFSAFNPDDQALEPCDCGKNWQDRHGGWLSMRVDRVQTTEELRLPDNWQQDVRELESRLKEELRTAIKHDNENLTTASQSTDCVGLVASMCLCFFFGRTTPLLVHAVPRLFTLLLLLFPACVLVVHVLAASCLLKFLKKASLVKPSVKCTHCGNSVSDTQSCKKCGRPVSLHGYDSSLKDRFPDFQRASYLTSFLSYIWPLIVVQQERYLQGRGWSLRLGYRPPLVQCLQVYEGIPTLLDLDLRWFLGLRLEVGSSSWVIIPIFDAISIEAHVRLRAADFLPSLPLLGNMSYCFASRPKVHIVWANNAVAAILQTFLVPLVRWILPELLFTYFGWPHWHELSFADPDRLGEAMRGVLVVTIVKTSLMSLQSTHSLLTGGKLNKVYFLEMRVGEVTKMARLMADEDNNLSSEPVRIDISNPKGRKLLLALWVDGLPHTGHLLGHCRMHLAKVVDQGKFESMCTLSHQKQQQHGSSEHIGGENRHSEHEPWLHVRLSWHSRGSGAEAANVDALQDDDSLPHYLFVHLDQAKNLQSSGGLCNPYCILNVDEDTSNVAVGAQKSKVISDTLNPIWREDFTFLVQKVPHAKLQVRIFDDRKHAVSLFRKHPIALGVAIEPILEILRTGGAHDLPLSASEQHDATGKEMTDHFAKGSVTVWCTLGPVLDKKEGDDVKRSRGSSICSLHGSRPSTTSTLQDDPAHKWSSAGSTMSIATGSSRHHFAHHCGTLVQRIRHTAPSMPGFGHHHSKASQDASNSSARDRSASDDSDQHSRAASLQNRASRKVGFNI